MGASWHLIGDASVAMACRCWTWTTHRCTVPGQVESAQPGAPRRRKSEYRAQAGESSSSARQRGDAGCQGYLQGQIAGRDVHSLWTLLSANCPAKLPVVVQCAYCTQGSQWQAWQTCIRLGSCLVSWETLIRWLPQACAQRPHSAT